MSNLHTQPCRIVGLTSEKGKKLNGNAAMAPCEFNSSPHDRVPVFIDGVTGPLALKRSNLSFFPSNIFDGGIGVGRKTLRDENFYATAVDNMAGFVVSRQEIRGGCARSRGNLIAAEAHLNNYHKYGEEGVIMMCTDLNVSRAINCVSNGGDAKMPGQLSTKFESIKKLIRKEKNKGAFVFSNFKPHRISPDGFERERRWGVARCDAVLSGAAKVYPCLFDDYRDSMEVRFVDKISSPTEVIVRHEYFLDYGKEEAMIYVQNASALGETERLYPSVLAQVDPQGFWSAVHHIETFTNAIRELDDEKLRQEWTNMNDGIQQSREMWRKEAEESSIRLPPPVLAGDNTDWCLTSDTEHKKIASGCATIAILMMIKIASKSPQRENDSQDSLKAVRIDMLDFYKGTEFGRLLSALSNVSDMEQKHIGAGKILREEDRDRFRKEAIEKAGFQSKGDSCVDPLSFCLHCGNSPTHRKDLKICAKCNGAAFCNRDCQRAAWKTHKKYCDPMHSHISRAMYKLSKKRGINVDTVTYPYGEKLPSQPIMLSETSGAGAVAIMWNPGGESFLNFSDINAIMSGDMSRPPVNIPDMVKFKSVSDLSPPLRFLLTCGPLNDIDVARGCVDEAIAMTGGQIHKLRMMTALFNPLEWAAKKGNAETVEWLCTDERTKSLIHEGCPVGWACYTGQVDIARTLVKYGADASKTDDVLWYSAPPLLVAAENGQLEAMKYLVNELGHDIHMIGPSGRNVLQSVTVASNWRDVEGHRKAYKWAKKKMG